MFIFQSTNTEHLFICVFFQFLSPIFLVLSEQIVDSLVKLIPKYFIIFTDFVKGIVFFSDFCLYVEMSLTFKN